MQTYAAGATQVTATLSLEGDLPNDAAMAALQQVHDRHEILQQRLTEDEDGWVFEGPVPFTEVLLETTEPDDGETDDVTSISSAIDDRLPLEGPLYRCSYTAPTASRGGRLTVTGQHAVLDGDSILAFCRQFVAATASRLPSGTLAMPDPIEVALGPGVVTAPKAPVPLMAPVADRVAATERSTGVAAWELDEARTAMLHDRSHEERTTVGAVLATALARAARTRLGAEHPTVSVPEDLRHRTTPPRSDEVIGLSIATPTFQPSDGGIWPAARALHDDLTAAPVPRSGAVPVADVIAGIRQTADASIAGVSTVAMSNLGVADFSVAGGPVEVTSFRLLTCMRWGACALLLEASTVNGRMMGSFGWCRPLVGDATARAMIDEVEATIEEAMS
ncbi:MAG: hypothetical protein GY812_14590 [Actinomycetia bacterium]|nr:hypothetical protein [Actinomycetes bacterium]